jgi:pyruvate/2-oxoglutarate dehydrogenase complex dihydrolipoamide dehydrogenase (E3) component
VVVDDYLRTTAPHIFAAGDINGRMMLVQSAGHEARIAAENAVLGPTRAPATRSCRTAALPTRNMPASG